MRNIATVLLACCSLAPPILGDTRDRAATASPEPRATSAPKALVLGDVHGDLGTVRKLLFAAGLIDGEDRWNGRGTHLIQTGDLVDRGNDSRGVLDLFMRLEKEAAAAGGRVVVLLGNHELWNVIGLLEYVSKGAYATFAPDEAPALRERKRRSILRLVENAHPLLRSRYYANLALDINERTFDEVFPPGCFAYREAFSPEGRYGQWLLKRPVVHRELAILFLHGGISPRYARVPASVLNREAVPLLAAYFAAVGALEELGVYDSGLGWKVLVDLIDWERRAGPLNAKIAPYVRTIERFNASFLMADDGPLMYRGLALGSERLLASTVDRLLATHSAERIVIGHTQPTSLSIATRFNHRVVLIDTGLNQEFYGGRPSLLAVYPSGALKIVSQ